MAKIKLILSGEEILSNSKSAFDLYSIQRIGEKVDEKILYSLSETLFLIEAKKADLYYRDKKHSLKNVHSKFEKIDKRFKIKYAVFKDLRKRGYVIKSALKFGADFRVYSKGHTPDEEHAKWILYAVSELSEFTWHDFSAKNRVAHSTNKNLLIAIVDEEADVLYYEIKWVKP